MHIESMTFVTKSMINNILNEKLRKSSPEQLESYKKNNIFNNSYPYSPSIFEQIDDFLDSLFLCFSEKRLLPDKTYTLDHEISLDTWRHVNGEDVEQMRRKLAIDRKALQRLLTIYIDCPFLWCKELDWLFVNSLLFAEFIATQNDFHRKNTSLVWSYLHYISSKTFCWTGFIWSSFLFSLKWFIFLIIFIYLYQIESLACYGFLVFILLLSAAKRISINKAIQQLKTMRIVYLLTKSLNFNWRILWNDMNDSRKKKTIFWDSELYNLIEIRCNLSSSDNASNRFN